MSDGILIENVVHSYIGTGTDVAALDRISLTIKRGEFVALVGPSGCGKTTLLDIMTGLVELQRGRVLLANAPPAVGRADTARMFARDALLPWRTAYANVDFAIATRNPDRDGRRAIIHALLKDVGLASFENAYPRQLSQGMRQKTKSTVVLVSHDLAEAVALADRVIVMSARPGRIAADIAIDLPRPRSVSALQSMTAYHELYARLWQELERATGPAMER